MLAPHDVVRWQREVANTSGPNGFTHVAGVREARGAVRIRKGGGTDHVSRTKWIIVGARNG